MSRPNRVPFIMLVAFAAILAPGDLFAPTFTTLNDPLGVGGTYAQGISGNDIVGSYIDASNSYNGFLYNGSTYTPIDDPFATTAVAGSGTTVSGIDGNTIVGTYRDASHIAHGFSYNISTATYTTINEPSAANDTDATGISGSNTVGYYTAGTQPGNPLTGSTGYNGYIYNGSSFATIDNPLGVNGTIPLGVSGDDEVGTYGDSSGKNHGFLYNGSTWTTIDDPLGENGDVPSGISGNIIVGYYSAIPSGQANGFLYSTATSTYTTLDDPLGIDGTSVNGIAGNNIVGTYSDASGVAHGFVATVPEPSSIALLGLGAIGLAVVARCRMRQQAAWKSGTVDG